MGVKEKKSRGNQHVLLFWIFQCLSNLLRYFSLNQNGTQGFTVLSNIGLCLIPLLKSFEVPLVCHK